MSSLEQARQAKRELRRRLTDLAGVVGIGITREPGEADSYVVVVRVTRSVDRIPGSVRVFDTEVGDVDVGVHTEIVGPIRPQ